MCGYMDADWAGDRTSGKSTSVYFIFVSGNMFTRRRKKQKVVSRSSVEAEFQGIVHGVSKLIWIKGILKDLAIDLISPMHLHCDNQADVNIANNPVQQITT